MSGRANGLAEKFENVKGLTLAEHSRPHRRHHVFRDRPNIALARWRYLSDLLVAHGGQEWSRWDPASLATLRVSRLLTRFR
jgi:hypothetical protein